MDEQFRPKKQIQVIGGPRFGPFAEKCSHIQPAYVLDLEIYSVPTAYDGSDFRSFHFVEQVEQGRLKIGYGDHCRTGSRSLKRKDLTCSAVS
jgi:hypothetical protein